MIFFYVIVMALPTAALAKGDLYCNLSESTGAQQCFGALGESLIFYCPTNTSTHLKKNNVTILKVTDYKQGNIHEEYSNHFALFTNATFKLEKAAKRDSGDYQLETYNRNGQFLRTINFHLEILAPVSQPAVSQLCLSPDQMKVSCSSEGDEVEFILRLDNNTLIQTRSTSTDKHLIPSVSNATISLHGQLTGNFRCQVQNKASRGDTVIRLTSCKGSISHLSLVTVAVIASVVTLLLHLALFLCIKHLNQKTRPVAVNKDNTEDQIVYSDVRVKSTRKTRPNTSKNAF